MLKTDLKTASNGCSLQLSNHRRVKKWCIAYVRYLVGGQVLDILVPISPPIFLDLKPTIFTNLTIGTQHNKLLDIALLSVAQ